jgi:hypothetical protein
MSKDYQDEHGHRGCNDVFQHCGFLSCMRERMPRVCHPSQTAGAARKLMFVSKDLHFHNQRPILRKPRFPGAPGLIQRTPLIMRLPEPGVLAGECFPAWKVAMVHEPGEGARVS